MKPCMHTHTTHVDAWFQTTCVWLSQSLLYRSCIEIFSMVTVMCLLLPDVLWQLWSNPTWLTAFNDTWHYCKTNLLLAVSVYFMQLTHIQRQHNTSWLSLPKYLMTWTLKSSNHGMIICLIRRYINACCHTRKLGVFFIMKDNNTNYLIITHVCASIPLSVGSDHNFIA